MTVAVINGYVAACYALVVSTLVVYAGWVVARYRAAERRAASDHGRDA